MGEAARSGSSDTDEQEHTLLAGGALQSRGEHVQSQDGLDSLQQSDGAG